MTPNQLELLNSRRFLPLFVTQSLGAFNDNVFKNAIVFLVTFSMAQQAGINAPLMVAAAAGVFITTGVFTNDGKAEASRDGATPIDLMDGEELAAKLKELGLGVTTKTIEEVIVDGEWFKTV